MLSLVARLQRRLFLFPLGVAELRAQACLVAIHLRPLRLELHNLEIEVGRGLAQETRQVLHPRVLFADGGQPPQVRR